MKNYKKINYILNDKNIIFKQISFCKNEKEIFQYLIDNEYKNIEIDYSIYVLNKNDNKIYFKNELPDNCITDLDLSFFYSKIEKISKNLVVNGNLVLFECKNLKNLSDGLVVKGSLILNGIDITKLPEDMNIKNNFELYYVKIETLPDSLIVNGDLSIVRCFNLKKLPNGLVVNGDLNLREINIFEIPEDIRIGGCLNFATSKIEKIPDNLKCNEISISKKQINLIKKTMDFNMIIVDLYTKYTKQEFFEKYEKQNNLSFSQKIINIFK